jgi:hypothetical protein
VAKAERETVSDCRVAVFMPKASSAL